MMLTHLTLECFDQFGREQLPILHLKLLLSALISFGREQLPILHLKLLLSALISLAGIGVVS